MRSSITLLAAACLAGCATTPPLQANLQPLLGQQADHAFASLGEPDYVEPVTHGARYIWTRSEPIMRTSWIATGQGEQGQPVAYNRGGPVFASCRIVLLAGADGKVIDLAVREVAGGCKEDAGWRD